MKAEIDELGMLYIISESPLEAYALGHWLNENISDINCPNLTVDRRIDSEVDE